MCKPIRIKFEISGNDEVIKNKVNKIVEKLLLELGFTRVDNGVFESISGVDKDEDVRDSLVSIARSQMDNMASEIASKGIKIQHESLLVA